MEMFQPDEKVESIMKKEINLSELIKTRRSIREFTDESVSEELLKAIVRSGIWAPTGSNQQEVRFYITKKKADINAILQAKPHIKNPQAAILVYVDVSEKYYHQLNQRPHKIALPFMDVGAACKNMLLTAHSYGLGACWVNISPYWPRAIAVFKRFVTKPTLRLMAAVFLGYPARVSDSTTEKHNGQLVQRGELKNYLLKFPPISRVICVHSISRNAANLGSQALSSGLRKVLHEMYKETSIGILGLEDCHLLPYVNKLYKLMSMESDEALRSFRNELRKAKLTALHACKYPGVPFGWLLSPYIKVKRKIIQKLVGKRGFSISQSPIPIVEDPFFRIPHDNSLIPEFPSGCKIENNELRVPVDSKFLEAEQRWTQRLNYRLRPLFFPSAPLRAASALRLLNWAQVVILDGNGHVADLYYKGALAGLFNLALAKSLGATVYSVNETVDVKSPVLAYLIKHIYNEIDGVVVREAMSKQCLVRMGVKPEKITVGADCAILVNDFQEENASRIAKDFSVSKGCIGLILRGDMSPDIDFWIKAVGQIKKRFGRDVIFLSSCEAQDLGFGRELGKRAGIRVVEGLNDYSVFVPFIKRFDAIITQRYHPVYFSILARVPFVPLSGNTLKIDGLLQHFEYPCKVLKNPSIDELINNLEKVQSDRENMCQQLEGIHRKLEQLAFLNVDATRF